MSTDDRWSRLRTTLAAALEAAPEDVEHILEHHAAGDAELLGSARAMLARRAEPGFLEPPLRGAAGLLVAEAAAAGAIGRRFGAYRVVSVIAAGGMGTVYRAARDDDAFERLVAIKTVPALLNDAEAVQRFDRERRLLARLSHPGIAALLDGGWTEDGVPYLVLEHVDGQRLTDFCRGSDSRLCAEIMHSVCNAVAHAHRNLIVHRDLKPDNILITEGGRPKLLDFGISKLLDESAEGRDVTMVRALTPHYASPEQLLSEPVTTASDVFSLGVILYELLSGRVPWDGSAAASDVQSRTAPPDPSSDRDLSAITHRALALDPRERYPSADALGDDLARYLAGEPVLARASTPLYRFGKLLARNKLLAAAAGITVLALLAAAGTLIWRASDVARERDRTREALSVAQDINAFLAGTLEAADAGVASGRELTVLAMLDDASKRVERELKNRPSAAGPLHLTIGRAYMSLGRLREAGAEFERTVEQLRTANGPGDPLILADAMESLALSVRTAGDHARATSLLTEALTIRTRLLGPRSEPAIRILERLGAPVNGTVDAAAESHLREALEGYRSLGAAGWEGAASCLESLASAAAARGNFREAASRHEEALAITREAAGPESDQVATSLARLGETYAAAGDLDRAESSVREALALSRRLHGEDHPTPTFQMLLLASVLEKAGKFDQAEEQHTAAIRLATSRLPEEHYIPVSLRHKYGQFLACRGRHAEAQIQLAAAYQGCVALFGPDHPNTRAVGQAMIASLEASGADASEWRATVTPR